MPASLPIDSFDAIALPARAWPPAAGPAPAELAERELAQAIREYQVRSGRMFPTWSEVLEVLRALGYRRPGEGLPA
jgi:hypothetical protein